MTEKDPWPALWALVLGFFMIMIDTTIVSVATPAIIEDLHAEVNSVVWVTSAYLLAYAVPVLITGRLGDRLGQKQVYLERPGGLHARVAVVRADRVRRGADRRPGRSRDSAPSMMTRRRWRSSPGSSRPSAGQATALWGATAGVAILVGPLLGGMLVDSLGWEWIFFINVPIGVVGFVMAWRLVPSLPTHSHRFDWLGVALSGVGMFLLVFGIQEGHQQDWGTIAADLVWR